MISTRDMESALAKKERELKRVTTKTVDASPKKIEKAVLDPLKMNKSPLVTTHNMADVADQSEKGERDVIAAQRKGFKKGDLVYVDEKGKLVTDENQEDMLKEFARQDVPTVDGRVVEGFEAMAVPEKKAWNKMNSAERKIYKAEKETEENEKNQTG